MAVSSKSDSSAPATSAASTKVFTRTPSELRSFADRFAERDDLHSHAAETVRLMREAFAARDREFPKPGCETFAAHARPQSAESSDDLTAKVLDLVQTGANEEQQLARFAWLGLFGILESQHGAQQSLTEFVRQILWLECNSRLALLTYAGSQLEHHDVMALATALTDLLRNSDARAPSLSRGEKCTALCWLRSVLPDNDETVVAQLAKGITPPVLLGAVHGHGALRLGESTLTGRIASPPRGGLLTAVTAFSGWLLLRQIFAWILRIFLGYRANAEVTLSEKGLEIRESRVMLGRRLREQTTVLAMPQIQHLSREVRFARAGTYAGLAALGFGSVLGMRLFVDGLRVPGFSAPLLLLGLVVVLGGLGLDFVFTNWLDSSKTRCRFLVVAEGGKGLCLANVEPAHADAILSELSYRLHH